MRRYFAAWDAHDLAALDGVLAADIVDHSALDGQQAGIEGYRQFFRLWRGAFPDFHSVIHQQVCEGELVATRWTFHGTHLGEWEGIAPTGRRVQFDTMSLVRVRDGRIAEEWFCGDLLGLRRQLLAPAG